ncbi:uncharacterized protein METZ01_LOCUS334594, partial [marine metagenome]
HSGQGKSCVCSQMKLQKKRQDSGQLFRNQVKYFLRISRPSLMKRNLIINC